MMTRERKGSGVSLHVPSPLAPPAALLTRWSCGTGRRCCPTLGGVCAGGPCAGTPGGRGTGAPPGATGVAIRCCGGAAIDTCGKRRRPPFQVLVNQVKRSVAMLEGQQPSEYAKGKLIRRVKVASLPS
jgi:hypothetical protein